MQPHRTLFYWRYARCRWCKHRHQVGIPCRGRRKQENLSVSTSDFTSSSLRFLAFQKLEVSEDIVMQTITPAVIPAVLYSSLPAAFNFFFFIISPKKRFFLLSWNLISLFLCQGNWDKTINHSLSLFQWLHYWGCIKELFARMHEDTIPHPHLIKTKRTPKTNHILHKNRLQHHWFVLNWSSILCRRE